MKGNRTGGEARRGYRGGRLPTGFSNMPKERIAELARSGSDESDAMMALGLTPNQVEKAKINKRWRKIWDKARAEYVIEKNRQISSSDDVRLLSLISQRTMPTSDLPDIVNIEVDAPKWLIDKLKNSKVSKFAQS